MVWATSGLLHPLMSALGPRAVATSPPAGEPLGQPATTLAEVLHRQQVGPIGHARLLRQDGELLWQWTDAQRSQWHYASASDGSLRPEADARRAEWLARHYSGEARAPVVDARLLTSFDTGYPAVNRLLPVWRLRFGRDDALTAYVHTGEDRLAALNDRRRTVLLMLFQALHTLHWLDGAEALRLPLIGVAVLSVLATTMLGLALVLLRPSRTGAGPLRRGHRCLALVVWLPALMFGLSGLFHLTVQTPLRGAAAPAPAAMSASASVLPDLPGAFDGLSLLVLPGEAGGLWRIQRAATVDWYSARDGQAVETSEAAVAARIAGLPPGTPADYQARFSDEYGFANKRLPVWRLEGGGRSFFVDLASGQVAAEVRQLDVLEQRSFSTLHKWQFLDSIGRGPRDTILAIAAVLLLITAGLGWRLRSRPGRGPA